jgi:hypothetical protein
MYLEDIKKEAKFSTLSVEKQKPNLRIAEMSL